MAGKKKIALSRHALILGGLAVVLLVLIIVFFTGGTGEKVQRFIDANVPDPPESGGAEPASKTVTLFFLADDDDLLHKETRVITAGPTVADEAERALAELIRGSEKGFVSPLPPPTKVRQIFVAKNGLATIARFGNDIMILRWMVQADTDLAIPYYPQMLTAAAAKIRLLATLFPSPT